MLVVEAAMQRCRWNMNVSHTGWRLAYLFTAYVTWEGEDIAKDMTRGMRYMTCAITMQGIVSSLPP